MTEFRQHLGYLFNLDLTDDEFKLAANVLSVLDVLFDDADCQPLTATRLEYNHYVSRILLTVMHDMFVDSTDFREVVALISATVNKRLKGSTQ